MLLLVAAGEHFYGDYDKRMFIRKMDKLLTEDIIYAVASNEMYKLEDIAREWCEDNDVPYIHYPVRWRIKGYPEPDKVLIFRNSKHTTHIKHLAEDGEIPIENIHSC